MSEVEKIKEIIKEEIKATLSEFNLKVDKVILFGSRAKGGFRGDSDWDILLILNKDITFEREWAIAKAIRKSLAKKLIDCDILIRTPGM